MAQTPTQRLANKRFAQQEEKKMGSLRPPKAERDEVAAQKKLAKKVKTTSVGMWMVYLLIFLLIGGFVLEMIRLFFG